MNQQAKRLMSDSSRISSERSGAWEVTREVFSRRPEVGQQDSWSKVLRSDLKIFNGHVIDRLMNVTKIVLLRVAKGSAVDVSVEMPDSSFTATVRTAIASMADPKREPGEASLEEPISVHDSAISIELAKSVEEITLAFSYTGGSRNRYTPVGVYFFDSKNEEIFAPEGFRYLSEVGPYFSLEGAGSFEREAVVKLSVPYGATSIILIGARKGENLRYSNRLRILESRQSAQSTLQTVMGDSENLRFVVESAFSSVNSVKGEPRHRSIIHRLEDLGHSILYVPNGPDSEPEHEEENFFEIHAYNRDLFFNTAKVETNEQAVRSVYMVAGYPSPKTVADAFRLKMLGWKVIYDCSENLDQIARRNGLSTYSPELERRMIGIADVVTAPTESLTRHIRGFGNVNTKCMVLGTSIGVQKVRGRSKARESSTIRLKNGTSVLGIYSQRPLTEATIGLLSVATEKFPHIEFEIFAPHSDALSKFVGENEQATWSQKFSEEQLVQAARAWKIGLVPFESGAISYTRHLHAIAEYLSLGVNPIYCEKNVPIDLPLGTRFTGPKDFPEALSNAVNRELDIETLNFMEEVLHTRFVSGFSQEIDDVIESLAWKEN